MGEIGIHLNDAVCVTAQAVTETCQIGFPITKLRLSGHQLDSVGTPRHLGDNLPRSIRRVVVNHKDRQFRVGSKHLDQQCLDSLRLVVGRYDYQWPKLDFIDPS